MRVPKKSSPRRWSKSVNIGNHEINQSLFYLRDDNWRRGILRVKCRRQWNVFTQIKQIFAVSWCRLTKQISIFWFRFFFDIPLDRASAEVNISRDNILSLFRSFDQSLRSARVWTLECWTIQLHLVYLSSFMEQSPSDTSVERDLLFALNKRS